MIDDTLREILDQLDFKLKPVVLDDRKFADEIVITGKTKAIKAIKSLVLDSLPKEKEYTEKVDEWEHAARTGFNKAIREVRSKWE